MPPTLAQLKRRHPQHRANADYWLILDALLQGGSKLTPEIKKQLLVNPDARPAAVVNERVKVARFFPKMGPIATRFLSQLFASPLQFEGSKDKFWADTFFPGGALLPEQDDDGRSSFNAFLRAATLQALGQGKAIAQIDTAIATANHNRKHQRDNGEDEPYCLLVPRNDLWDWASDRQGFKFAKLHRFTWQREQWDGDPVALHDFTIYQRQPDGAIVVSRYTVKQQDAGGKQFDGGIQGFDLDRLTDSTAVIETVNGLENQPIFHVGQVFKFPIVTLTLPPALWLADQLHDAQVSHFNQTASVEYGLVASNYAMPTVTTQDIEDFADRNKRFGEGYYLHLDPSQQEAVGWTERPGNSFSTSIGYREKVENDIDKTVQQVALSAADAVSAPSGEALRQARKPEVILLSTYGAMVREFAQGILAVAAIARGEKTTWKLSGLDDFDATDLQAEGMEYGAIAQAQIPSKTFTKAMQKAFVREVGRQKEWEPQLLATMLEEIDQAPEAPMAQPGGMPPEDGSTRAESDDHELDALFNDPKLAQQLLQPG